MLVGRATPLPHPRVPSSQCLLHQCTCGATGVASGAAGEGRGLQGGWLLIPLYFELQNRLTPTLIVEADCAYRTGPRCGCFIRQTAAIKIPLPFWWPTWVGIRRTASSRQKSHLYQIQEILSCSILLPSVAEPRPSHHYPLYMYNTYTVVKYNYQTTRTIDIVVSAR